MIDDLEKRIRERAYEIWQNEGQPEGRAEEHWRQACAEFHEAQEENAQEQAASEPAAAGAQEEANTPARGEAPEADTASTGRPARRGRTKATASAESAPTSGSVSEPTDGSAPRGRGRRKAG